MSKKFLLVIFTISLLVGILAGCGDDENNSGDEDGKITLSLLRPGDPGLLNEIFDEMIAKYEEENEHIEIDFQTIGFTESNQRYAVWASNETFPDVFYTQEPLMMAYNEYYVRLDEYLDNDEDLKNDIFPNLRENSKFQGETTFIPANGSTLMLWYNKEIFEEAGLDPDSPPSTTEELVEYAKIITEKTGTPAIGLHSKVGGDDLSQVMSSFYQLFSGEDVLDSEKQEYTFLQSDENKQALVDAFQYWYDLDHKHGVTQPNITQYERFDIRPLFEDGQVAMLIDGIWMMQLEGVAEGIETGKYANAALPEGPGGSNKSILNFAGWSIAKNSEHPEEAWKLIQYLMETENQITHSKYGSVPILASEVEQNPEIEKDVWQVALESVESGTSQASSEKRDQYHLAFRQVANEISSGAVSPEEGVNKLIESIKNASD